MQTWTNPADAEIAQAFERGQDRGVAGHVPFDLPLPIRGIRTRARQPATAMPVPETAMHDDDSRMLGSMVI